MKRIWLVAALLAVVWGIWTFATNKPDARQRTLEKQCDIYRPPAATASQALACMGRSWEAKHDLERNAAIAIVAGSIAALVAMPWSKLKETV